jgi:hypothetical protein
MRFPRMKAMVFLLMASAIVFAVQTRRFTRSDIDYELELPSPAWRAIPTVDVHTHLEFVNGNDPSNGYLRLRKIVVAHSTTAPELFAHDEKWELQRLPGYVVCSECNGVRFNGQLSGDVFSYEYVSGGRTMYGRIYYLQVDGRTFYSLRFAVARDKLPEMQGQMDLMALSFRLK